MRLLQKAATMVFRWGCTKSVALVAAMFVLVGCGRSQHEGAGPQDGKTHAAARAEQGPSGPAVLEIDADVEKLARQIEEGVNAGAPTTIYDALDWEVLMDRISAGIDTPANIRSGFLAGMRNRGTEFDRQLVKTLDGRGSFKLLRLHKGPDGLRGLYRMLAPDSAGVNYYDFLFVRSPGGPTRLGDMFIYLMGEDLSKSMRRLFIAGLEHENRGILARLTKEESAVIKHMPAINQMAQAVQTGDGAGALAIYRTLPQELQELKMSLAMRLRAAQSVNDEEYLEAIDALRRKFGNDPSIHLILIDGYFLKGNHEKALASIDALDRALGGDPYLHVLRANMHLATSDLTAAKAATDKAMAEAPELSEGFVAALTVALTDKRFQDAAGLMQTLTDRFGMVFGNLEAEPLYAEFVKSPEYQAWLAKQPAQSEATPADGEAPSP
jgi:hypothetical protein